MTSLSENKSRQRLANALGVVFVLFILCFWGVELKQALDAHDQRAEAILVAHKDMELERKGEALSKLFSELYTNTRTISLLPMIRSLQGNNRRNEQEDVVAAGRLSLDAHHTMQQIYTNLQTHIRVSEVYYVLDGFDRRRGDVPFFMYDDLIVGRGEAESQAEAHADVPDEVEEFEYEHFPGQLAWFREHAPRFSFADRLDQIPVRLSPMMRTCDNSQFLSEHGNVRDVEGLIYAMPVYSLDGARLRGMITAIVRNNTFEARLIGVPYLPLTRSDRERMGREGWTMPAEPSPFLLRNAEYGIDIFDRRHPTLGQGVGTALQSADGRWFKRDLDLRTGSPWQLHYHLSAAEIDELTAGVVADRREALLGRLGLLVLLLATLAWVGWLVRRGRRELLWMAHYDALTELPNRRAFFERLKSGLARAERNQSRAGLFFIDIAGFNAVNDTFGQRAGDILLSAVGQRLVECVRGCDVVIRNPLAHHASDTVARLGGDEFTILCEDLKSTDDLAAVGERLIAAMSQPIVVDGNQVEISLYIGIASYPEDAADGEALLMAAESAMQMCRENGCGLLLYNEEMRKRAVRQHQLSIDLNLALERQQFQLFYQPKADIGSGRVVSLEALLRWNHPEHGLVLPVEFIPLLERSGRIVEVGEWVLQQSCRDLTLLDAAGHDELKVSANVSVRQLRRGNFHETVARVLAESGTAPQRLILEITESMVMENLQEGQQALERLEALGVSLAIDDFGTGFSSLTYLQYLPLDYLKLDKSFIDGMTNDRARHIVRTVIVLAKGLNLLTIAEGIETESQRDELRQLGCEIIQGYWLSKPKPLPDILSWLAARPGSEGSAGTAGVSAATPSFGLMNSTGAGNLLLR